MMEEGGNGNLVYTLNLKDGAKPIIYELAKENEVKGKSNEFAK